MADCHITYDDNGQLDEVFTDAGAHLERMSKDTWFLSMERSDGSSFCVWFHGKPVMIDECYLAPDDTPTQNRRP